MAFLNEDGLQEFAKLLIEKGEWLGADPATDDYFNYKNGEYGVRASFAREADEAGFAYTALDLEHPPVVVSPDQPSAYSGALIWIKTE